MLLVMTALYTAAMLVMTGLLVVVGGVAVRARRHARHLERMLADVTADNTELRAQVQRLKRGDTDDWGVTRSILGTLARHPGAEVEPDPDHVRSPDAAELPVARVSTRRKV